MVWSMETDAEPPLSVILPRLYLGAERDVTQDGLASHGISYVLSVSRCSPQPSFLPASRYMRIPIDDSLWADLLPWIPQALHFIDEAISSGASVLVHCAAGISRSPALAVAYIMYSLGMDMDQAYRFVKERRPSISPNFNFLGQLQQFQGTLTHKSSAAHLPIQLNDNHSVNHTNTIQHNMNQEATHMDNTLHTHPAQPRRPCSDIGSFSGKHKTLHLTLNLNLNQQQQQCGVSAPSPCEPVQPEVAAEAAEKPTQLHLPAFSASSLRDKRKSLTLSLTPLGTGPMAPAVVEESNTVRRNSGWCRQQSQTQTQDQGKEQGLMSPFSFSLNKLLDWGERLLLGGLSVQPVRMGTPALPYRC